ncbi:NAC domain-containing protein 83-like [Silene latifolia]|uniref:NAC domain-containing protein 83-like n=1 Tax=Silene latifolia TaxID=37657 RepID=UPI003D788B4A
MKLPIGFRFRPTDEELVVHYLKRKAMSLPLPASVIPELHAVNFDPWSLPGDLKEKRYYFMKRKGNKFSKVMSTSFGFWKVNNGKVKHIFSPGAQNDVVGIRKTWTFHLAKSSKSQVRGHSSKTRWVMHEFQLIDFTKNETYQDGDWIVCRIFQRKMKHKKNETTAQKCTSRDIQKVEGGKMGDESAPNTYDFEVNNFGLGPPQPTSPCSTTD